MNVTASPMPLVVNGKEYTICPLSDYASHSVTQWLRADLMSSAWMAEKKVNTQGGNGAELATTVIQAALQIEWTDNSGVAVLRSDAGLSRLLCESLKPSMSGITQSKAAAILKSTDEVKQEFWDIFLAVNDLIEVEDDGLEKKKPSTFQPDQNGALRDALRENESDSNGTSKGDAHTTGNPCGKR